jgi:hypothetical protein
MGRSTGLGAWLATLPAWQLEALLRARPDVLRAPVPGDLVALANRLSAPTHRDASGAMVVQRAAVRRAAAPPSATTQQWPSPVDVSALAARLSGAG